MTTPDAPAPLTPPTFETLARAARQIETFVSNQLDIVNTISVTHLNFVSESLERAHYLQKELEGRLSMQQRTAAVAAEIEAEERQLLGTLDSLQTTCDALEQEHARLRQRQAELEETLRRKTDEALHASGPGAGRDADAASAELRRMHWVLDNYATMLRLRLEPSDDGASLRIVFTGINPRSADKEYSVTFRTNTSSYEVLESSDEIPQLSLFLDDANMTNNFSLLVRRIRRSFVQIAEYE